MSIGIMNRVWKKSECKGTDLLLLLALADNADDDGYCWPGIEYLAAKIRMTPQSVINITTRIEKAGELLVKHNRREGNRYLILVEMTDDEKCAGIRKMRFNAEQQEAITQSLLSKACFTSEPKDLYNRTKTAVLEEPSLTIKESSIYMSTGEKTEEAINTVFLEILSHWAVVFPHKPQPTHSNKTLRKKLKIRLKESEFRENWRAAITRASKSTFCNKGSWCKVGWFLVNDDNWRKALDGDYDNTNTDLIGPLKIRV